MESVQLYYLKSEFVVFACFTILFLINCSTRYIRDEAYIRPQSLHGLLLKESTSLMKKYGYGGMTYFHINTSNVQFNRILEFLALVSTFCQSVYSYQ